MRNWLVEFRLFWDLVRPVRKSFLWASMVLGANAILGAVSLVAVLPLLTFVSRSSAGNSTQVGNFLPFGISSHLASVLSSMSATKSMIVLSGIAFVVFAMKAVCSIGAAYVSAWLAEELRLYWLDELSRRYFEAPYRHFILERQGAISNNIIREPTEASRFAKAYPQYLMNCCMAGFIIVTLVLVDWFFVICAIGLAGLVLLLFRKFLFAESERLGRDTISGSQLVVSLVQESVRAIKEIKVLGRTNDRRIEILTVMRGLSFIFIRFQLLKQLPSSLGELLFVLFGLGMLLGAYFLYGADMSVLFPKLAFFAIALTQLSSLVGSVSAQRMTVSNKAPSARLVLKLAQDPRLEADSNEIGGEAVFEHGDIVCDQLSFTYPDGRQALNNVSLTIKRGSTVCFLGASGAGKSTLVDILVRLQRPTRGRVLCGGVDIALIDARAWRNTIGYVGQDTQLFRGTLRENIPLTSVGGVEELDRLADIAGIRNFVRELPLKWDTRIGEGGLALSGGQRQRLAIARALARHPELLILDEATTSFEEELERDILSRIRQEWPNLTIVIVTHRLSILSTVGQVYVLEQGRLMESGVPKDVILSLRERKMLVTAVGDS